MTVPLQEVLYNHGFPFILSSSMQFWSLPIYDLKFYIWKAQVFIYIYKQN